ncbi:MAG: Uncharacterized protein XD91_0531 [Clostridiales bacterium 38_11]|nr:MAG: Uncharacterized protein XD91_0531 [Clostridiales bacterium 38_11]HBH13380.1 hypothetical protein [Clostridiales bacterium]
MVGIDRDDLIAIVDYRMNETIIKQLNQYCSEIIMTRPHPYLMEPVNGHPDMVMMQYDDRTLIVCPEEYEYYQGKIAGKGINIIRGTSRLNRNYPWDIPYNAIRIGKTIIHHIAYTDKMIVEKATDDKLLRVDVKQGYTKCSVIHMKNHGIITADRQLYEIVNSLGIDSLLVRTGHVELNGFDYGFVGGASGYHNGRLFLTGTLVHHPDCCLIQEFLESKSMQVVYLSNNPLYDYGTIIILNREEK